jgi:hypothetical protein
MEEEAKIQTKGKGTLFNELTGENFPNLYNDKDIHVQEAF